MLKHSYLFLFHRTQKNHELIPSVFSGYLFCVKFYGGWPLGIQQFKWTPKEFTVRDMEKGDMETRHEEETHGKK